MKVLCPQCYKMHDGNRFPLTQMCDPCIDVKLNQVNKYRPKDMLFIPNLRKLFQTLCDREQPQDPTNLTGNFPVSVKPTSGESVDEFNYGT